MERLFSPGSGSVVLAARFQQQHVDLGIRAQPVREQAAGGACSDDDVVEWSQSPGHFFLRHIYPLYPLDRRPKYRLRVGSARRLPEDYARSGALDSGSRWL
jgi:hypothetical protein